MKTREIEILLVEGNAAGATRVFRARRKNALGPRFQLVLCSPAGSWLNLHPPLPPHSLAGSAEKPA
jgi:hypothetical protein